MPGLLYDLRSFRQRSNQMEFLQHWRKEKGYDLYPVLRLILPQVLSFALHYLSGSHCC